jgi:hypothetical protein
MTKLMLLKPHRHGDTDHPAGDRIEVDAVTARWMTERGIARPIDLPAVTPAPAAVSAEDETDKSKVKKHG